MTRYTFQYVTASGRLVRLFNLADSVAHEIEATQTALGSFAFNRSEQRGNYSQEEIDLLRAQDARHAQARTLADA